MKNWIKSFFGKIQSRKFMVEIIATVAFFCGKLSEKGWILISIFYIGGNILKWTVEIIKLKIGGKNE